MQCHRSSFLLPCICHRPFCQQQKKNTRLHQSNFKVNIKWEYDKHWMAFGIRPSLLLLLTSIKEGKKIAPIFVDSRYRCIMSSFFCFNLLICLVSLHYVTWTHKMYGQQFWHAIVMDAFGNKIVYFAQFN